MIFLKFIQEFLKTIWNYVRLYTNGQNNTLIMGLKECKAEDEGDFACIVTTAKGSATFDFKLFVTVEGGMDFR